MQTHIKLTKITTLLKRAKEEKRKYLFEHEVYNFIELIGGETPPQYYLLPKNTRLDEKQLLSLPGNKVVVKVVSPFILHKSDVGGVTICKNSLTEVLSTIRKMSFDIPERFSHFLLNQPALCPRRYQKIAENELQSAIADDIKGFLICQYMEPDSKEFGNELLVSLRNTREFGIIISAGLGGRDTELYAARFRKGQAVVSAAVELIEGKQFFELFKKTISYKKLAGLTRSQQRIVTDGQLEECFEALIQIGKYFSPSNNESKYTIEELEVNPFAFSNYMMMPLDGLCKFSTKKMTQQRRPIQMINQLLHPESIGIMGVSAEKMNIGRIIMENILANGFAEEKLTIIHSTASNIDGIPTLPELSALQDHLDLFILAIEGSQLPEVLDDILNRDIASSIILVSGELGTSQEQQPRQSPTIKLQQRIISQRTEGHKTNKGPVILGGNSLGVLSHPGNYDSMFIPDSKLPKDRGKHGRNTIFVSQSGAYMITRMSKLCFLDPAYAISIGNQIDLSTGDFINYFNTIDEAKTLAFYIEGFTDLDGLNFAKGIEEATRQSKEVIFYKAGRTQEGKDALSGHTSSIAGDYMVCDSCITQAGAMVAETFAIFEGLLRLSTALIHKTISGNRLAAISNAGFEAVGIADNIIGEGYRLEMATLNSATKMSLKDIVTAVQLDSLVVINNPLDLTPMASEDVYIDVVSSLVEAPDIDMIVVAIVPLTPMLHTLAEEILEADHRPEKTLISEIGALNNKSSKPIIVVLDSGRLFDTMAESFESEGLPVFRSADICITALGKYVHTRLANQTKSATNLAKAVPKELDRKRSGGTPVLLQKEE